MNELVWGDETRSAIKTARDGAMLGRFAIAGFDPGDHGAVALRRFTPNGQTTEVAPIGDERCGTWIDAAEMCVEARVALVVCETQHAPTWHPKAHPKALTAQAGMAMRVARSAGLMCGWIAGRLRTSHDITVVYVQPAVWQRYMYELPGRYKSEDAKKASLGLANQAIPRTMENLSRAPDRLGAADAFGLLQWGLTASMETSPFR